MTARLRIGKSGAGRGVVRDEEFVGRYMKGWGISRDHIWEVKDRDQLILKM